MPPEMIAEQVRSFLVSLFGAATSGSGPVVCAETKTRIVVLVPGGQHVLVQVSPATVSVAYGC